MAVRFTPINGEQETNPIEDLAKESLGVKELSPAGKQESRVRFTALQPAGIQGFQAGAAPPPQVPQQPEPGFFGRVKGRFVENIEQAKEAVKSFGETERIQPLSGVEAGFAATAALAAPVTETFSSLIGLIPTPTELQLRKIAKERGIPEEEFIEQVQPFIGPGPIAKVFKAIDDKIATLPPEKQEDARQLIRIAEDAIEAPLVGAPGALLRAGKQVAKKPLAVTAEVLKKSAQKDVQKVLAPTKEVQKQLTTRILPEFAETIPVAASRESLLRKVSNQVDKVGTKIDDFVEKEGVKGATDANKITQVFEELKDDFQIVQKSGKKVIVEEQPIKILEGLQKQVQGFADKAGKIQNEELLQVRRIWDKLVQRTKGFQKNLPEGTELQFKKEATNAIRKELAESNPKLAVLNKEFATAKGAEDILRETVKRKVGQKPPLTRTVAGFIGAESGEGFIASVLGAKLFSSLSGAFESTFYRTVSANIKNKLANALVEGNKQAVKQLLPKLGAGVAVGAKEQLKEE